MLPRMENIKCRFSFFNNWSTSRSVLALNTDDSKILVNYKVLDLQFLFLCRKNQVNPVSKQKDMAKIPKLVKIFPCHDFFSSLT